jgi:hypothetical protein
MPPFNGNGTFSAYTPGNPAVTGSVVSSTAFNNTVNDIATGLSNTLTRDGQSPATANIPMGGNKLTNLANGTAATDAAAFGQFNASSGATNVGFIQSGTGSVAMTVQDKLQQYQSVVDNMTASQLADVVAGTASIDVTAAIQAAHDKLPANGGVIDFPVAGLYLLSTDGVYVNITKPNVTIRGSSGAWVVNPASSNAEITAGSRYLNGFTVSGNNCVISVNMRGCANVWTPSASTDRLTLRDMKMLNLYNSGISIGSTPFDTLDVLNVEFNTSRDLAADPGNYEMISRGCNGNTANYGKLVRVMGCLFKSVSGGIDVHNVKDVVVGGGTRFEGVDITCIKLATLDNAVVKQNLTVDKTVTFDGAAINSASANRHISCTGGGRPAANYSNYLAFIQVFDKVDFSGKAYNFSTNYGVTFLDGSYVDAVLNFDGAEFESCTNAIKDYQGSFNVTNCRFKNSNIVGSSITQLKSLNFRNNKMIDSVLNVTKKCAEIYDQGFIVENTISYSLDNLAPIRFVNYATDSGFMCLVDKNLIIIGGGNTLAIDGSTSGTQMFIGGNNYATPVGTWTFNGVMLNNYQPTTGASYVGSLRVPFRNGELTMGNDNATTAVTYAMADATSVYLPIGTTFNVCKTNAAATFALSGAASSFNGAFSSVTLASTYAACTLKKIGANRWSVTNMSGTVTLA